VIDHAPRPELHRPVPLERIGPAGLEIVVEASADECAALARRFGVPAVLSLTCRFHLAAAAGGVVAAKGELTARLTRVCVVTLDEFAADVTARFGVRFVPAGTEADALDDPESEDEIPYDDARLDLGEAAAQQVALEMDPYPRRPGAALPAEAEDDGTVSPFAALDRGGAWRL
jgi:hypothetical protein